MTALQNLSSPVDTSSFALAMDTFHNNPLFGEVFPAGSVADQLGPNSNIAFNCHTNNLFDVPLDAMQERIDKIVKYIEFEQNLFFVIGRCLRYLTNYSASPIPLSQVACRALQTLDRQYLNPYFVFQRCTHYFLPTDRPKQCARQLHQARTTLTQQIQPAQKRVESRLNHTLFSRPLIFPPDSN